MTDIKDNPKKFFEEVKFAYIENEKTSKELERLVQGVSIKIEGKKQSTRQLKKKVLDECDKIREELIKKVEEHGMTFQKDGRLVKIEQPGIKSDELPTWERGNTNLYKIKLCELTDDYIEKNGGSVNKLVIEVYHKNKKTVFKDVNYGKGWNDESLNSFYHVGAKLKE